METIEITVTGSDAKVTKNGVVVSGTVGLPVAFSFDEAWDGLQKTAVFRVNGKSLDRVNIADTTTVPWELLQKPGCRLLAGIYGTNADGSLQIPTLWADLGVIQPGADPSGDESADPTLPVWAQTVLYTPQSRTEEEKAQARRNIGVESTYVINLINTIGDRVQIDPGCGFYWDDLVAAVQQNRPVICRHRNTADIEDNPDTTEYVLTYIEFNDEYAIFSSIKEVGFEHITVLRDGACSRKFIDLATSDDLQRQETTLGDIENALDIIIAIQESLIGGATE